MANFSKERLDQIWDKGSVIRGKNPDLYRKDKFGHYCPVKILDLEINRVDHHPLGR